MPLRPVHQRRCRWQTGGMCWPTCDRPSKRWLAGAHGRLRRLPVICAEPGVVPARLTGPFPCSASDEQTRLDSRMRRLTLYDEVQRRHAAGEALIAIARAMGLAHGTVRNYAYA